MALLGPVLPAAVIGSVGATSAAAATPGRKALNADPSLIESWQGSIGRKLPNQPIVGAGEVMGS
jgi:hypothetical protein